MEDIKLVYVPEFMEWDISFEEGDLVRDLGLETSVLLSLFSDRRASVDDHVDDITDLRGWWGDIITQGTPLIGSKLWLLQRQKTTNEVLGRAKQYIEEALEWMIDDGVCKDITVTTERVGDPGKDVLAFSIKILKNDETSFAMKFDDLWSAQYTVF